MVQAESLLVTRSAWRKAESEVQQVNFCITLDSCSVMEIQNRIAYREFSKNEHDEVLHSQVNITAPPSEPLPDVFRCGVNSRGKIDRHEDKT